MPPIYVDANVFITAFETREAVAAPARALFSAGRANPLILVTSELTIAEVLAPHANVGGLPLSTRLEIYQTVLLRSGFIDVVPVTRDILLSTASLRAAQRQKLPDAIHIATALHRGCTHFCSADRDMQRLPAALSLIMPDDVGIANLLAGLGLNDNSEQRDV